MHPAPLTLSRTTLNRLSATPVTSVMLQMVSMWTACVVASELAAPWRSASTSANWRAAQMSLSFPASSSVRPVPLGWRNLMPLYGAGLCDAVMTTPPSAPRCEVISATPGVVAMSRSIALTPQASSPAVTALRTMGPLVRPSRPMTTVFPAPSMVPKAAPKSHATAGVSVVPIVPRTPETPTISLSVLTASLPCPPRGGSALMPAGRPPTEGSWRFRRTRPPAGRRCTRARPSPAASSGRSPQSRNARRTPARTSAQTAA